MRLILCGTALVALAACAPEVPDSASGAGFENYSTYSQKQAARDAQLSTSALPSPLAVSTETLSSAAPAAPIGTAEAIAATEEIEAEALASATAAALNSGRVPLEASPSNPPPAVVNAAGISEETNFSAVSAQRSIQDDAARRETLKSQYQVIQPTALPTRSGSTGPNIVEFALSTSNAVGTPLYKRLGIAAAQRYDRNCAKYPSADLAQQDFLARGGPKTDRMGLDPDGDGFACSWNPEPFRKVRG
ncbi:MAG: hypothetical protein EBS68_15745 [Rhodobacteraceae bacterium]|nr:hypothetical protein [Paracoccaceae bacterium]